MVPIDLKNGRARDVELLHELTKGKEGKTERGREKREILSSTHSSLQRVGSILPIVE